jgi:cysteine protease ATG4
MILEYFFDKQECPFSIHKIAQTGTLLCNKKIGEWFGPSTIAFVFKKLVHENFKDLKVYVADQGTIYIDQINKLCDYSKSNQDIKWKPLIVLFPLRLGLDHMNPVYFESIKKIFQIKQTLGIVGGQIHHSLFFVGFQNEELFYLDPHYVQKISNNISTYHNSVPRKIKIQNFDPSLVTGFFCSNKEDWNDLLKKIKEMSAYEFPIFTVLDRTPSFMKDCFNNLDESVLLNNK